MKIRNIAVLGLALPALLGAGTCGILFDLWSWDEITDHAERLNVDVTEGAVEIAAYSRTNIWIQRHVYAFERTIEEADYSVDENEVAQVVFHCDGRAVCFADHWLEIPSGMPVTVELGLGSVSLISIDAATVLTVDEGPITGDVLAAPTFEIDGGTHDEITLKWAATATPTAISIDAKSAPVTLELPAGTYACDITTSGEVDIDPAIVCEDGADASLVITLDDGDVVIDPAD